MPIRGWRSAIADHVAPAAALFRAAGYVVVPLADPQDRDAITALSAACADYARLVTGRAPTPHDGAIFLSEAPPDRGCDDTLKLGIRNDTAHLIGVLDVVRDYPEPRSWYIGLLLIDPRYRGAGLGRTVIDNLAEFARSHGARRLRLGVVQANVSALRFWTTIGFQEIRRVPDQRIGDLAHTIIEFNRDL